MSARRGSQTIERLPSARGPHSMRPWNQPTTLPSAIAAAVRRHSSASSAMLSTEQPACIDLGLSRWRSAPRISRRAELRTPIGMIHHERPRTAELVPERKRRADRAAGIARGRLHVDATERRHPPHFAVGDRVHGATAGERRAVRAHSARAACRSDGRRPPRTSLGPSARCRDADPRADRPARGAVQAISRAPARTNRRIRVSRPSIDRRSAPCDDENMRDRARKLRRA